MFLLLCLNNVVDDIIVYVYSSKVVPLFNLGLVSLPTFSLPLVLEHITSSMLLSVAHLAGYLDQHHIPALLQQAHSDVTMGTDNKVHMMALV